MTLNTKRNSGMIKKEKNMTEKKHDRKKKHEIKNIKKYVKDWELDSVSLFACIHLAVGNPMSYIQHHHSGRAF